MSPIRAIIWAVAGLLGWELAMRLYPQAVLISSPLGIARHIAENASLLARATWETSTNAAWGFLWGNLAAVILGSVIAVVPRSARALSALALLVFCIPLIASGPILRVLFGPGVGPQIALGALAVYYTTLLAFLVGVRAVSQNWTDLMQIYGRGTVSTFLRIRARASLPYLFVGLQISAPAAFLGAMIGEFTGAERGLGVLTLRALRGLDTDATWALACLAALIAMSAYALLGWLGDRLVGYRPVLLLSAPSTAAPRSIWIRLLELGLITGLVLVLWQVSMDGAGLNRFFAKRPGDVWAFLMDPQNRATIQTALVETLAFAAPGYIAGLALGAGLAAALMLAPGLSRATMPVAVALRAVPIITTAPLLVLAFGRGLVGTMVVVAVMIFFPTFVACQQGLRQTPGQIVDLFKSYEAGRWHLLRAAQLPAMLPAFFASARMAVPAALLAVTTVEWLATGKGIGLLMAMTASTSDYNMLWSCVAVLAVVAVTAYGAVAAVERSVLRIYASEQVT
ncbi:ABC-type nitrate/sulfonate/bicarbonate transport system permease component [Litoreibacter ponti]|uniref:ABC-type nitrate/sulfonate/bicarbonate transport system permease component n=1 Tax=Litoreibacter ponti TaxID=1510457 RepID=A0A2T6BEL3_9RHOB|nr:ABC transporter permease subunit [Litoreibacter ponti]PTX54508.1 ABC-type nitrate/sulfonate/bicarbonate transport system permease component [Litoreibacter ponti]